MDAYGQIISDSGGHMQTMIIMTNLIWPVLSVHQNGGFRNDCIIDYTTVKG